RGRQGIVGAFERVGEAAELGRIRGVAALADRLGEDAEPRRGAAGAVLRQRLELEEHEIDEIGDLLRAVDGVVGHAHRGAHRLRHVVLVDGAADRKSTRLNSSHDQISYAVFCLKKKKKISKNKTQLNPYRIQQQIHVYPLSLISPS